MSTPKSMLRGSRSLAHIDHVTQSMCQRRTATCRKLMTTASPIDPVETSKLKGSVATTPDAKFEITGAPPSLLSVSLSASQRLYTRRGTLVGLSGKAENTISTLSVLEPFSRLLVRVPFLYQKITSTTPISTLISTKSTNSSITTVHLDGTTDWMLAGQTLLAWTGQTISLRPTVNYRLNIAHWGRTEVTGRGLLALAAKGSVSEITLKEGETYVVHPSHLIAYSITAQPPSPYRFASSSFRLQIPNILSPLPDTRFFRTMRESDTWRTIRSIAYTLRTWARRTIWGDRLFLQFNGPATLLLQSRASSITEILSARDLDESADVPPGALDALSKGPAQNASTKSIPSRPTEAPTRTQTATVGPGGKVEFSGEENSPKNSS